jgi:hypothetical protein
MDVIRLSQPKPDLAAIGARDPQHLRRCKLLTTYYYYHLLSLPMHLHACRPSLQKSRNSLRQPPSSASPRPQFHLALPLDLLLLHRSALQRLARSPYDADPAGRTKPIRTEACISQPARPQLSQISAHIHLHDAANAP